MMYLVADSDLGMRIRRARERKRVTGKPMTQQQLADAVGASVRAVGAWERGESVPMNAIGALEQVLGVDLSEEAPDPREQEIRDMDWLTPQEQDQWIALYRQRKAPPPGAARQAS